VIENSVYGIYFARCMNIFNSLLPQPVKYDVHTTSKINSIHAIFYHILSFSRLDRVSFWDAVGCQYIIMPTAMQLPQLLPGAWRHKSLTAGNVYMLLSLLSVTCHSLEAGGRLEFFLMRIFLKRRSTYTRLPKL